MTGSAFAVASKEHIHVSAGVRARRRLMPRRYTVRGVTRLVRKGRFIWDLNIKGNFKGFTSCIKNILGEK